MKNFWDERYASESYVYGTEPNEFFKTQLAKLPPGKLLLPAEGEGRNAVFAAKSGWQVTAFDQSVKGMKKALSLSENNKVSIDYSVSELSKINYKPRSFDCMGLIFAHFPAKVRTTYYNKLDSYLRKGAYLILEGFSKKHLQFSAENENPSGPRNIDMLFSIEEIQKDFSNYEVISLVEKIVTLDEGSFHKGKSATIQFVGKKKYTIPIL